MPEEPNFKIIAREGGKIMTRVGLVQIEIKDEEKI